MAKVSSRDPKNEISAQNILNFLQTNNITNEIFLEILSEIKDKQGYKCLKKMVLDLISKHEEVLYSPITEKTKRASIMNEVCTIAFTIDTIFPNVIRMKLQKEMPNIVDSILAELKEEQKIESFIPFGKSSTSTFSENSNKTAPSTSESNGHRQNPKTSPNEATVDLKRKFSTVTQPIKSLNSQGHTKSDTLITPKSSIATERQNDTRKVETSPKNAQAKRKSAIKPTQLHAKKSPDDQQKTNSDVSTVPKSPIAIDKQNITDKALLSKEMLPTCDSFAAVKSPVKSKNPSADSKDIDELSAQSCSDKGIASTSQNINEEKDLFADEDSDSNSELSVGNFSRTIPSVSSVNTSDLSSYDDAISLYSDDGGGKVKVSINDIQKVKKTDRITAWCAENFNSIKKLSLEKESNSSDTEYKPLIESKASTSGNSSRSSLSLMASDSNSPQKVLPQRVRKPNSKYASESILCPITQKQQKRILESDNADSEKVATSPMSCSPKKKKFKHDEENEKTLINSPQVGSGDEKGFANLTTPLQNSPDVFKPFTAIRPLTSRKTAPKTLFSTATHNIKK